MHLFEALNQQYAAISGKSNIDLHLDLRITKYLETTFGIRILQKKAFESIFGRATNFIISIGNDIPGLMQSYSDAALKSCYHLSRIRSSQDGGDYLIGNSSGNLLEPTSFAKSSLEY